ncbi:MAG: hypothetical protein AAB922_02490 [Patescibacteria group bacterium]
MQEEKNKNDSTKKSPYDQWKDYSAARGLKPGEFNESVHLAFLKETGVLSAETSDIMQAHLKAKRDRWKNVEKYTPVALTGFVLLADSVFNFLPKDWRQIIFVLLGFEILVIFVRNTVKKEIREAKED